uniref:Uncharacterized protein n=1 Tax=Cacopsylla melanoneura TaxID=428564 RepID=A0A8D9A7U1_9HEMI
MPEDRFMGVQEISLTVQDRPKPPLTPVVRVRLTGRVRILRLNEWTCHHDMTVWLTSRTIHRNGATRKEVSKCWSRVPGIRQRQCIWYCLILSQSPPIWCRVGC